MEDIYVSGVKEENITVVGDAHHNPLPWAVTMTPVRKSPNKRWFTGEGGNGHGVRRCGAVQSGRDTIDTVLKTILPFMALSRRSLASLWLLALVTGLPTACSAGEPSTGSGHAGAHLFLPLLSPFLGPGAVIAQVIGVLLACRLVSAIFRRIWLYRHCCHQRAGGLRLHPGRFVAGGSRQDTVRVGVPSVLVSRFLTGRRLY